MRCFGMRTQGQGQTTVLVVEDDPLMRFHVSGILNQAGFEVIGSSSGARALAVVADRPDVEVVVSDVVMPGEIDGFALARHIRTRWPRIGVVLVSGQKAPSDGEIPRHVCFLAKPIRAATLLRIVRQASQPAGI
jgi:CheY-like chemotaxis protein